MCKFVRIWHRAYSASGESYTQIESYINTAHVYGFYREDNKYFVYCIGGKGSCVNWHETDRKSFGRLVALAGDEGTKTKKKRGKRKH